MDSAFFRSNHALWDSTSDEQVHPDNSHCFNPMEYAMSFSLFLVCMRNGEPATFKNALFDEVMGRHAIDPEFPLYAVKYSDGGCDEICNTYADDDGIESVSFSHFDGNIFFDALWELADRAGAFFAWPAEGRGTAVTSREFLVHLPADMASMGPPYVAKNGRELYDAICGIDPEAGQPGKS
jgi:hypothetical protein